MQRPSFNSTQTLITTVNLPLSVLATRAHLFDVFFMGRILKDVSTAMTSANYNGNRCFNAPLQLPPGTPAYVPRQLAEALLNASVCRHLLRLACSIQVSITALLLLLSLIIHSCQHSHRFPTRSVDRTSHMAASD